MSAASPTDPTASRLPPLHLRRISLVLGWFAFATLYWGASSLGLALANRHTLLVPVWPAAGLSLAVLLRFGWRQTAIPLVVIAFGEAFLHGDPWLSSIGAGAGNALGPLLGAVLTERFAGGQCCGENPKQLFRFAAVGVGGSAVVSATLGTLGVMLSGGTAGGGSFGTEWLVRAAANALGALLFAPLLLAWSRHCPSGEPRWRSQPVVRWLEAFALALACLVITQFAFGGWPFPPTRYPIEYLTIPLLIWAAFRFPGRGVVTAVAGLGGLAIGNTLLGNGTFAAPLWVASTKALIELQMFLGCTALMALATASGVRERLAQAAALEGTVAERTAEILASNERLRTELTERSRAEEALRESRAMLRLVIDMIPQAIWWKDRNSVYLGCNRAGALVAGLSSPEKIVGLTDDDLPWTREQTEHYRAVDTQVMGEDRPVLDLHERLFRGGKEVWLETNRAPLHDADGRVVGMLGTSEDITARLHIEQETRAAHDDLEARVATRTAELARANEDLRREVAERVRAAAALLENEHQLRHALEVGRMSAWRLEPAAKRCTWYHFQGEVEHLEEAFPDTPKALMENIHPEDRSKVQAAIDQCIATGQRVVTLYRYRSSRDRRERWIETSGRRVCREDGRVDLVGVSVDVSDRKRTEEALRQSESRLRLALEAGHMRVWRINRSTGHVAWSVLGQGEMTRGWSPEAFPSNLQEFARDVHPEDRENVMTAVDRCHTRGEPISVQYRYLRHRDSRWRWLESRGQPTQGPEGCVESITGLSMDITERKEQEALLLVRANRQRSVATLGQCALAGLNTDALLRDALGLLTDALDVELGAVCEHRPESGEFILRVSHGFPEGWIGRCLARNEPGSAARRALQGPVVVPDIQGETRFRLAGFLHELDLVSAATVVIAGELAGGPFGIMSVYSRRPRQFTEDDVTFLQAVANILAAAIERRRVETTVQAARREAERANAAKSEFLSRMSHELRTPLNAILGFGQLLEFGDLSSHQRESVDYILGAGRHLLGLIDKVLDIARIESGNLASNMEPVSVDELLAETLSLLRPLAAERGVWLPPAVADLARGEHVLADRQQLKQILLNLLSNAIKYNRANGRVTIGCQPLPGMDGGKLRLDVQDTGVGLTETQLTRLFVPFDRLGAEGTGIEGTGIGLVLSRGLAESMGGTIRAESQPGVGSTFSVELPRADFPAVPGAEMPADMDAAEPSLVPALTVVEPAGLEQNTPGRTVLYIEDNVPNLQLIERIFERRELAGPRLRLLSAMLGSLGLELARRHCPDLILLDLQLPDISGEEVLRRLRMDPATMSVPVVVLSADATPQQAQRLLAAGATDYVTKPIEMKSFLALLATRLE